MKTYRVGNWGVDVPEDWVHEKDEKGDDKFYPPNDTTTLYALDFTADRKGVPAPAKIHEDFFAKNLVRFDTGEIPLEVGEGFGVRAFYYAGKKGVYCISAGVFTAGNLLVLNISSENEDTVYRVAEQFSAVKFYGENNAV